MMTIAQVKTATLDQLTDELAAAGWDSTQQTLDEAREAVTRLLTQVTKVTDEQMTACLNRVLPVVADSWAQLRKSDVFRLLDQVIAYTSPAELEQACNIIYSKRPDLRDEIVAAAVESIGINKQVEPIKLIRHVLGAEVYQDAQGTEWYCRPNGELVFNIALRPLVSR